MRSEERNDEDTLQRATVPESRLIDSAKTSKGLEFVQFMAASPLQLQSSMQQSIH